MPAPPPNDHARVSGALLTVGGLGAAVALASAGGIRLDATLAVVCLAAVVAAAVGSIAGDDLHGLSLVHLPVLAAVYVCSGGVAALLAAALAVADSRSLPRAVMWSNIGNYLLSATAAAGTFAAGRAAWGPLTVGRPGWFAAAALAALAYIAVNHLITAMVTRLRHGAPFRSTLLGQLRSAGVTELTSSLLAVGCFGVGSAVREPSLRLMVGLVGVTTVGLLVAFLAAVVHRDAEAQARGDAEQAERRAVHAERSAVARADTAVAHLHEVATGTVLALVALVDLKDRYTARHSAVVGRLCRILARELGWSSEDQAFAHVAGLVHDIGKVGVPDDVLRKAASPTPEEWAVLRRHAAWGADALANVALAPALIDGVRSHHERWDGSGYPGGLSGEAIPVLARLVAVCDTYDAVTSARPFRVARPHQAALDELVAGSGLLFDPAMADALVATLCASGPPEAVTDGFPDEWRAACAGIDMGRMYMPVCPAQAPPSLLDGGQAQVWPSLGDQHV